MKKEEEEGEKKEKERKEQGRRGGGGSYDSGKWVHQEGMVPPKHRDQVPLLVILMSRVHHHDCPPLVPPPFLYLYLSFAFIFHI